MAITTSISMMLRAFAERGLMQALGESNEAELGADALPAVRYFGGSLGLQRGFLEFANVRETLIQGMLNFLDEYCFELAKIAGCYRMIRSRNYWPIIDAGGLETGINSAFTGTM